MIDGRDRGSGLLWFRLILAAWVTVALARANAARAAEPGEGMNACGCRGDSASGCYCDRKAKCGCPGECEPKGCEEKRAKQFEKEIERETKKAEAAGQKERPAKTDEERAPPAARAEPAEVKPKKHPEHRMTPAERRALHHLLDVYIAEHPESRQKSLEETRAALTADGAHQLPDR